ncbi:redoxin domain-containing protein, partial [candidate division WOR-3 bacterium]|nr:redoxin domain-containing protein [candidate division WOR-3 bacterium]
MCGPQAAAIDGTIYERYDTSRVAVLAIGADSAQLSEFRDVFGMRCLGLTDPSSSVYNAWRVPNPTAPYPQDYIIDQQGRVAHWDDQFDPQEVMNV